MIYRKEFEGITKEKIRFRYDNLLFVLLPNLMNYLKPVWIRPEHIKEVTKDDFLEDATDCDGFVKEGIKKLGDSIEENGMYYPFLILHKDGEYSVFNGQHRMMALQNNKKTKGKFFLCLIIEEDVQELCKIKLNLFLPIVLNNREISNGFLTDDNYDIVYNHFINAFDLLNAYSFVSYEIKYPFFQFIKEHKTMYPPHKVINKPNSFNEYYGEKIEYYKF